MGKNRGCPKWIVLIFSAILDFSFSGGAIEAVDCIQPQDDEIIAKLDLFAWRSSVQPGQSIRFNFGVSEARNLLRHFRPAAGPLPFFLAATVSALAQRPRRRLPCPSRS